MRKMVAIGGVLCVLALAAGFFCRGISSQTPESYKAHRLQTIRVMAHGYCWVIKNLSVDKDYYVPAKTAAELEAFIAAAQGNPDFDLNACFDCSNPAMATIVGTVGADVIWGTAGDDIIFGLEGADTIYGGNGNDVLCGNEGADAIYGGDGADYIDLQDFGTAEGGDSGDIIWAGSGASTVHGNDGDDVIYGDAGADALYGDEGWDTIYGGLGDPDLLDGGLDGSIDKCYDNDPGTTFNNCEEIYN